MPALTKARRSAQQIACMSNLRQISMAFVQYSGANRGWLPAVYDAAGASVNMTDGYMVQCVLSPYLGQTIVFDASYDRTTARKVWVCPSSGITVGNVSTRPATAICTTRR